MTAPLRTRVGITLIAVLGALALLFLLAGPGRAAAAVYPAGGGTFSAGAEGWIVSEASCDVPLLCSASGGYDAANGVPAGSLSGQTNIALNLLSLFHSTVTFQSPDFTVAKAEPATLHLERQFDPGSLIDLNPRVSNTATLIDRTAGKESALLNETVTSKSGFIGKDAAATVVAGHTYTITITAKTRSTIVGTGLLSGATATRFDNVALTVGSAGGGGGGSGSENNGGGLSDSRLGSLIQGSLPSQGVLGGNRLLVKLRCPAKVGRACKINAQGLLNKRRPATTKRMIKIANGKSKQIALMVKPKAKSKVAGRKKLLFRVRVKAGPAKATAYKRLKLIRRP